MGQKTQPIGFRLGINRTWDSRWFGGKSYADLLHQDISVRKFLFEKLKAAGIFHDNPESAIYWIKKVYFDIEKWWFDRSVQDTRMAFCDAYCRCPDTNIIADKLGLR